MRNSRQLILILLFMKRNLFLLSIIAIFVCIQLACNNSEDLNSQTETKKQQDDLKEFVIKQKQMINRLKSRSNSAVIATKEQVFDLASELDSCREDFVTSHPELLSELQKEVTEDELTQMLYDHEVFSEFIARNYSDEILNDLKNYIEGNYVPSSDDDALLSPATTINTSSEITAENYIQANLEVAYEFEALVVDVFCPEEMKKKYQNKSQRCIDQYNNDVDQCLYKLREGVAGVVVGLDWTTVVGTVSTNAALLIQSYRLLLLANEFNQCIRFADLSMDQCQ